MGVTKLYNVWASMKQRCYNTNAQSYHSYGGRGIRVCDKWVDSFHFSGVVLLIPFPPRV